MLFALALACFQPTVHAASSDLAWVQDDDGALPMSLTAADGTGLALVEMHVDAVVEQPLAFTELRLVFENPEDRVIEGRFEITLPDDAAVSRFAMKIDDVWQEGEVVELQAARRAYEDFLHRRTDPALLEFDAGNEFRARVFPIAPRSKKEILISWSHDLDAGEAWTLPTGGLPELGLLDAQVVVDGQHRRMRTEYAVPEGDLSAALPEKPRLALRGANTSVVTVVPELSVAEDPAEDMTVLVDTSASRALSFEALLEDVAAAVDGFSGKLKVVAYDQEVVEVYEGPAKGFGSTHLQRLRERGALGASDLGAALEAVGETGRLVVFTDGVLTAGETELADLKGVFAGADRVDAVVRGGARDLAGLRELVALGDRTGAVLDADTDGRMEVGRRLALGTSERLAIEVDGASWVHPAWVEGLQPGDSLTVYADVPADRKLELKLGGRKVGGIEERSSTGPLLVRASAQAQIGALLVDKSHAESAEERQAIIDDIVDVSVANRVLSPHTALLVLETEADYERFDIPRNALKDILVVEDGELAWLKRKAPVFVDGRGVEAPEDDERPPVDADDFEKAEKKMRLSTAAAEEDLEVAYDEAPAPEAEPMAAGAPPPPARPRPARMAEEARRSAEAASAHAERARRPDNRRERARLEAEEVARREAEAAARQMAEEEERKRRANPFAAWEGDYREVQVMLSEDRLDDAERFASAWLARSPGDPLALLAMGEVWQRMGQSKQAARAFGALIDLFPSRADLRRLAGERLETLGDVGLPLATDTFRVAVGQRGDHPSGHRLLAWALVRNGEHEQALGVLKSALELPFDRFEAAHRILREDAALIAAAWKAEGGAVEAALEGMEVEPATSPDLRFVLNWETDANDVDFHIYDADGGHAYYSSRNLPSGGSLYADITTGYGPECFSIPNPEAFPYTLQAHYYSRGPMGFGMGKLQVIEHDGKGGLHLEDRPFVVMTDGAFVPLGEVKKSAF